MAYSAHGVWLFLSVCLNGAFGFGGLAEDSKAPRRSGYGTVVDHPQLHKVNETAQACRKELGHTLGDDWFGCVLQRLLKEQDEAEAEKRPYFPMVPHTLSPLKATRPAGPPSSREAYSLSSTFKDTLRDISCDVADGGSQPVRTTTWEHFPREPCPGASRRGKGSKAAVMMYRQGYLPAGGEMEHLNGEMTEAQAAAKCSKDERCVGFTYNAPARDKMARHRMHFKSAENSGNVGPSAEWHSLRKRRHPERCSVPLPDLHQTFAVDVLRESPPVFVVHDFATEEDCAEMVRARRCPA